MSSILGGVNSVNMMDIYVAAAILLAGIILGATRLIKKRRALARAKRIRNLRIVQPDDSIPEELSSLVSGARRVTK